MLFCFLLSVHYCSKIGKHCAGSSVVGHRKHKLITIHTSPQNWNEPAEQLTHIRCGAVPGQSDDSTSVFNVIYENYEPSIEAFYCYYNINTISEGVWNKKDFHFVGRFIKLFSLLLVLLYSFLFVLLCFTFHFLVFYAYALSNCFIFGQNLTWIRRVEYSLELFL